MIPFFLGWANPYRLHNMPHPDDLVAQGFVDTGRRDPRYPDSVLMRREEDESECPHCGEDGMPVDMECGCTRCEDCVSQDEAALGWCLDCIELDRERP